MRTESYKPVQSLTVPSPKRYRSAMTHVPMCMWRFHGRFGVRRVSRSVVSARQRHVAYNYLQRKSSHSLCPRSYHRVRSAARYGLSLSALRHTGNANRLSVNPLLRHTGNRPWTLRTRAICCDAPNPPCKTRALVRSTIPLLANRRENRVQ